jgi:hypothetical protein
MKRVLTRTKQVILSVKYRYLDGFIFIHINKNGGSSVEKALNIPFEHKTALEKIKEIGQKDWNRRLTFTVIRNPWDKVVSHYHYRVKTNQTNLRDDPIEFNEWVKRAYGNQDAFYYDNPKMFMPQTNWITDEKGNILVDEIIHFENLENEFNKVLEKLGKNVTLPHVKKSDRGIYRDYYEEETIAIVKNWFEQDIERFDYRF